MHGGDRDRRAETGKLRNRKDRRRREKRSAFLSSSSFIIGRSTLNFRGTADDADYTDKKVREKEFDRDRKVVKPESGNRRPER
jgi:hypothetical protein